MSRQQIALVIHPDETVKDNLFSTLKAAHYRVVTASTAEEGRMGLGLLRPHLILIDRAELERNEAEFLRWVGLELDTDRVRVIALAPENARTMQVAERLIRHLDTVDDPERSVSQAAPRHETRAVDPAGTA